MDEEIGKWLLDISKYIILISYRKCLVKIMIPGGHLLVQSYWLFYCLHWDII